MKYSNNSYSLGTLQATLAVSSSTFISAIRTPEWGGHRRPSFLFNEVFCGAAPDPRAPPRRPEKDKEGKENLSLSPHKNLPAFLSLFSKRAVRAFEGWAESPRWR